jgi:hypothetical protein
MVMAPRYEPPTIDDAAGTYALVIDGRPFELHIGPEGIQVLIPDRRERAHRGHHGHGHTRCREQRRPDIGGCDRRRGPESRRRPYRCRAANRVIGFEGTNEFEH